MRHDGATCWHPQGHVRERRVVRWHPRIGERMTKEVTAWAPSMEIKVVTPPERNHVVDWGSILSFLSAFQQMFWNGEYEESGPCCHRACPPNHGGNHGSSVGADVVFRRAFVVSFVLRACRFGMPQNIDETLLAQSSAQGFPLTLQHHVPLEVHVQPTPNSPD